MLNSRARSREPSAATDQTRKEPSVSDSTGKDHKNWPLTFAVSLGLFLALYLATLWFGNRLVGDEHHAEPHAAEAAAGH